MTVLILDSLIATELLSPEDRPSRRAESIGLAGASPAVLRPCFTSGVIGLSDSGEFCRHRPARREIGTEGWLRGACKARQDELPGAGLRDRAGQPLPLSPALPAEQCAGRERQRWPKRQGYGRWSCAAACVTAARSKTSWRWSGRARAIPNSSRTCDSAGSWAIISSVCGAAQKSGAFEPRMPCFSLHGGTIFRARSSFIGPAPRSWGDSEVFSRSMGARESRSLSNSPDTERPPHPIHDNATVRSRRVATATRTSQLAHQLETASHASC